MQNGWIPLWYLCLLCQLILLSFLLQPPILLIIYAIAKRFGIRQQPTPFASATREYQFGIIITAHRETDFIPPIVDSLLKQTHTRWHAYIVADDCDTGSLLYTDPRVHILKPSVPLNDQLASLDHGFRHFSDQDEVLVVFDPDNLLHPEFLRTLNAWYNAGHRVVVGNMQSKNKEGVYAGIDNWGATLGNFVDRDMRSFLGLSASITGCGISVETALYRRISYDAKSKMGGFDKQLQLHLVRNVHRIVFAREAVFFDEKVADGHSFERQRIRWIAAYFKFLGESFTLLLSALRKRSFNMFFFAYNLLRPPYFILLLLSGLFLVADGFIAPRLVLPWLFSLSLFSTSFLLILAKDRRSVESTLRTALVYVPRIFYRQLRALTLLRLSKRSLLKTKHSRVVFLDEVIDAASVSPPAAVSNSQNPPQEYASSPPAPAKGKKQDYAHSRSSAPKSPLP
jgi:cellulose synthase/poly-beta-1,6-N-acetylglucosamine synthase-like glycosyltransferase